MHKIKIGKGFFLARQRHEDHSGFNAVKVPQSMFYMFFHRNNKKRKWIFPINKLLQSYITYPVGMCDISIIAGFFLIDDKLKPSHRGCR